MIDEKLFRTRSASTQVFRSLDGAQRRAAFETAHSKRVWRTVRCDGMGRVTDAGAFWKLASERKGARV